MAEPRDLSTGRRPARRRRQNPGGGAPRSRQSLAGEPGSHPFCSHRQNRHACGEMDRQGRSPHKADGGCLALCQTLRRGRRGRRLLGGGGRGVGMDWSRSPRRTERKIRLETKHESGRRWGDGAEPSLAENGSRGLIVAQSPPPRQKGPWRLVGRFGCTRRPVRGPLWGVRVCLRVSAHVHACTQAPLVGRGPSVFCALLGGASGQARPRAAFTGAASQVRWHLLPGFLLLPEKAASGPSSPFPAVMQAPCVRQPPGHGRHSAGLPQTGWSRGHQEC